MKISRSDTLYVELDKIENHSIQYQIFLEMMRLRFFYDKNPKETKEEYITWTRIKEYNLLRFSNDREFYQMKLKNEIGEYKEYFITDYAYFNNTAYQLYVNIDFSLPKEMLIAQISQLKEDIEQDKDMQDFFQSRPSFHDMKADFIPHKPIEFARSIKRKYGDFLFVLDCKNLEYKNQDIVYSIYDFRKDRTSISQDTIRKYLKIAQDLYKSIEEAQ